MAGSSRERSEVDLETGSSFLLSSWHEIVGYRQGSVSADGVSSLVSPAFRVWLLPWGHDCGRCWTSGGHCAARSTTQAQRHDQHRTNSVAVHRMRGLQHRAAPHVARQTELESVVAWLCGRAPCTWGEHGGHRLSVRLRAAGLSLTDRDVARTARTLMAQPRAARPGATAIALMALTDSRMIGRCWTRRVAGVITRRGESARPSTDTRSPELQSAASGHTRVSQSGLSPAYAACCTEPSTCARRRPGCASPRVACQPDGTTVS
jgi:hypothetical protein